MSDLGLGELAVLELPLGLTAVEWVRVARLLALPLQQARITALILDGKPDKQIAAAMGLRIPTVRTHLSRIFTRLGVSDRHELTVRVFQCIREMDRERPKGRAS